MKFSIQVNRWANFYFFIQNLAEWHFSNRKDYNELWKMELGEFSNEEESVLKKFKEIRLQYKQSKTFFEQAFFTAENPWKYLEKSLPTEECVAMQEIFTLFEKKFDLIYKKDSVLLERWKEVLQKKINDPSLVEPITDTLIILFNTPPSKSEIDIYLLFSTPNHTGGGANIDDQSVSIEVSRYPIEDINHAIGIIWHETIHLCFDKEYFRPLLEKFLANDRKKFDFIKEITVSSLFPNGILGREILKNKDRSLNARISPEQDELFMDLMRQYMQKKKTLDESYINSAMSILASFQNIPRI